MRSISGICRVVHLSAGEVIFREGEINKNLYMLLKGEVTVYLGPDQAPVGKVLAGDVLGEISLIED
ncbi:MAG: cyclic nucleotide-binding domain-containing protein, partial [candidate division Zixibacteria bacterium]|nr:cyclic nucleotide-binding domain-containing protein [candidate division Zixibacteria bacterium]